MPIFNPKTPRPPNAERYLMKLAVRDRDGLAKGCYWCGKPFDCLEDATLEHITALADGGLHTLENCSLACPKCNSTRVPESIKAWKEIAFHNHVEKAVANRLANGGPRDHVAPEECNTEVVKWFESIYRQRNGKKLERGGATQILRNIHRCLGWLPPHKPAIKVFQGHFNRWANEFRQAIPSSSPRP